MNATEKKNLELLQKAFHQEESFSVDQVCDKLKIQRSTAHWLLSNLSRSGEIIRVGRGIYSLQDQSQIYRNLRLSEEIIEAIKNLRSQGITFALTGLDILLPFVQHQPNKIFHLFYGASGTGTWMQSQLRIPGFLPIFEPQSSAEIENLLDAIDDSTELIIIRERSSMLGSDKSIATLERAFIDLYFESSRQQIPFSLFEVAHIFVNLTSNIKINTAQMLRYAHSRSIRDEIQNILDSIEESRTFPTSENSERFLRYLQEIR